MRNQLVLRDRTEIADSIPYLDGIRGMAIFLVALGHIFWEIYFFKISWIGLNLFFILSGYLITRCLFQYRSYSSLNYFRNFYGRRILRIFPLYYGVLIFFFLCLPLISRQINFYYSELNGIQGYYWLYASNWNMIWNGMPHQPVFFHFWSLAVEEQFYLIWPVLFLICSNSKARYIVISIILGLSVATRTTTDVPLHAYLSSLTAAEPLLLGCLICVLQEDGLLKRIRKVLNAAAILSLLFLCGIFFQNPDLNISNVLLMKYGYSAIDIVLCSLVCATLTGFSWGAAMRKFFSMTWLRWLGKYSYSIYIFHWIILQMLVYKLQAVMNNYLPETLTYLVPRIIGVGLTLLISYFSYNYFEKHFLSLKKHFSGNKSWHWHWNISRIIPFKTNRVSKAQLNDPA